MTQRSLGLYKYRIFLFFFYFLVNRYSTFFDYIRKRCFQCIHSADRQEKGRHTFLGVLSITWHLVYFLWVLSYWVSQFSPAALTAQDPRRNDWSSKYVLALVAQDCQDKRTLPTAHHIGLPATSAPRHCICLESQVNQSMLTKYETNTCITKTSQCFCWTFISYTVTNSW